MGYLIELDPPPPCPPAPRPARARRGRRPRPQPAEPVPLPPLLPPGRYPPIHPAIEKKTDLRPEIMAWVVWSDTAAWLGVKLPESMIQDLVTWAETLFALNPRFRRLIQRKGDSGRDWLRALMRHWLCDLIGRHDPDLGARLPDSYAWGHDLPQRPVPRPVPQACGR